MESTFPFVPRNFVRRDSAPRPPCYAPRRQWVQMHKAVHTAHGYPAPEAKGTAGILPNGHNPGKHWQNMQNAPESETKIVQHAD